MPASNTPAPERPTHVRVLSHQHGDNLTTGRVYQVLRWLDDRPVIRFNGGYEVSLSHTTWEPAPAPSGPETPWERYMQQEWPMDRDRFNALVAAEVARATAEWKARAEKAEAALRGAVGCMPTGATQAHEEAGARVARMSDQEMLDLLFADAPVVPADKTQEPSSAASNAPAASVAAAGGGSATSALTRELRGLQRNEYVDSADRVVAALRPWMDFAEGMALQWRHHVGPAGVASRALLAATEKEGK